MDPALIQALLELGVQLQSPYKTVAPLVVCAMR
ncbi:hypothetical protein ATK17_1852 [Branchiibius hedensis]|uniref:Uncharacterized protein n=1 Tax=Branchiibius hedensis TaxID=672460 RepID=A0A2Y8ZW83_9MICO|nr:hypothetical protein ATK17_1852 [Branchiibius hedensis]SSA34529.1 hypothetical protein SAMN04489750_1852 [Branchiibius hedensis]